MFTYSITPAATVSGGQVSVPQLSYSAGAERNIDEPIPTPSTDLALAYALIVAKCVFFWMSADQALTIEFNNSTTGTPTIVLAANKPYLWTTDMYDTFKLTVNVTSIFVTNASGVAATLKIRALEDPT